MGVMLTVVILCIIISYQCDFILKDILLSVIMLTVIMLNVIMLSVIMPSASMLRDIKHVS